MLENIKSSGKKTFLLTNSDWWHTRQIMTFLLGKEGDDRGKEECVDEGAKHHLSL